MKARVQLQRIAARIDAMSLRERVFLFGSVAMVMMAVADQAVITPSLHRQATWHAQLQATQVELAQQREELTRLSMPRPPGPPAIGPDDAGRRLAQLQRALAEARAAEAQLSAQLQPPAGPQSRVALQEVLAQVLQQHRGVTLLRISLQSQGEPGTPASAPPVPLATLAQMAASDATAADPVASRPSAPASRATWRPLQLSVSGSFADLRAFILTLEQRLPGLRWGTLILDADASPPAMSVQLWLAGSAP